MPGYIYEMVNFQNTTLQLARKGVMCGTIWRQIYLIQGINYLILYFFSLCFNFLVIKKLHGIFFYISLPVSITDVTVSDGS